MSKEHCGVKKTATANLTGPYNLQGIVVNGCSTPISSVNVSHTCGGNTTNIATNQTLPLGGSAGPVTLASQSGSHDYWNVSFTDGAGKTHSREGKQCDVTSDYAGKTVTIILRENDFDVNTPDGDGCFGNHY